MRFGKMMTMAGIFLVNILPGWAQNTDLQKSKEKQPPAQAAPATGKTAGTATTPAVPQSGPPPAQELRQYLKENQLAARLEGTAKLTMQRVEPAAGKIYTFKIMVDLTGCKVVIEGQPERPAVLGAYTLAVSYDPARVQLVDVLGGETKEFSGKPVFTNLEKANKEGVVRFAAVHVTSDKPAGKVKVAVVQLAADDPAALSTVKLWADSLASSMIFFPDRKLAGPFSIPFDVGKLPRNTIPPLPGKTEEPPAKKESGKPAESGKK